MFIFLLLFIYDFIDVYLESQDLVYEKCDGKGGNGVRKRG
jgi:hypothetical protein